ERAAARGDRDGRGDVRPPSPLRRGGAGVAAAGVGAARRRAGRELRRLPRSTSAGAGGEAGGAHLVELPAWRGALAGRLRLPARARAPEPTALAGAAARSARLARGGAARALRARGGGVVRRPLGRARRLRRRRERGWGGGGRGEHRPVRGGADAPP